MDTKNRTQPDDRSLDADELEQFEFYRTRGYALLDVSSNATPRELVQAIDAHVCDWQWRRQVLRGLLRTREDPVEPARALGVVWGDQIVRHFDWRWVCVLRRSEPRFGVVSPDRSLAIYAPQFLDDCLRNPGVDCTVMLAFNMQEAGDFTGCAAGEYVDVMRGVHRVVPKPR